MNHLFLIIFSVFLFSGCTTQFVPIPSSEIADDKARVELTNKIYRNYERVNIYVVKDNGVLIGEIGGVDGKLIWDRPPGNTCVTVGSYEKLCFNTKAGEIAKLTFQIKYGLTLSNFNNTIKDVKVINIR